MYNMNTAIQPEFCQFHQQYRVWSPRAVVVECTTTGNPVLTDVILSLTLQVWVVGLW